MRTHSAPRTSSVSAPHGCLLAFFLVACSPSPAPNPTPSSQPSGVATAAELHHAPRPLRGEAPGGSPRRSDPYWKEALGGDPLALRALAEHEGALGLLEGVEDGGDLFRVAVSALPFASDADLALGRLGEIALLEDAALADASVSSLRLIAMQKPTRGELLDPDGVSNAAHALAVLASRENAPKERRSLAISAARAFAERGALDPATIPTALDPPSVPGDSP
ncbi:MAG: thiamine biosynthesis protein [Polyangiaceae bacterium]|nr:thiamine biosynthesis protein [Polyangiaceae bacterium]